MSDPYIQLTEHIENVLDDYDLETQRVVLKDLLDQVNAAIEEDNEEALGS